MGRPLLKYLLDSVILIDHFNGIDSATTFLTEHGNECAISIITRAEVLVEFDVDTEPLALELLDTLPTLPLTSETADIADRLRRTQRWKLPDAFQAAVSVHHGPDPRHPQHTRLSAWWRARGVNSIPYLTRAEMARKKVEHSRPCTCSAKRHISEGVNKPRPKLLECPSRTGPRIALSN
jgi:predicted nucleic acid-binding protein